MDGLERMLQEVVHAERKLRINNMSILQRLKDLIKGLTIVVENISCGKKTMDIHPRRKEELS